VHDAVDLLGVELWQALGRHVVNEKVVADLRVRVDALAVGLRDSLRKDPGVLGVKQQVDARQLGVLLEAVPVAREHLAFGVVGVHEHGPPLAAAVLVLEQALARNRREVAVSVKAERNPLFRQAAVVLSVVERLQRQPVRRVRRSVAVVDALNCN